MSASRGNLSRAFGRPIPLDATGRPDFKRPGIGEEIAITKAQAVGEPAARGQRAELWMEALAIEDENRLVLGEVDGPLHAVRLVGLDLFGLSVRAAAGRPLRVSTVPATRRRSTRGSTASGSALLLEACGHSLQRESKQPRADSSIFRVTMCPSASRSPAAEAVTSGSRS